jgi:putative two-component system response regulator
MENERSVIMVVDDDMTCLTMGKDILQKLYTVFAIPSGERFFEILEKVQPDLVLLDVAMPGMDGFEVMKRLKEDVKTVEIPVIFLTARNDPGYELKGFSLGAVDYVSKPFSPALLIKRIENHLLLESQKQALKRYNENLRETVKEQTKQIGELQYAISSTVAELVEFRERKIGGHIGRIQGYLRCLIDVLVKEHIYHEEIASWNINFVIPSSQLHDVGKIFVAEAIVQKPGRLNPWEFEEMKKHAEFGVWVIDRIARHTKGHIYLDHARIFAGAHHEKWDGSGYPKGLRGTEIPLEGRLMAIVDVYDALIAERPYKPAMNAAEAEAIILGGRESHFDPVLVDIFQDTAPQFANIAAFPDMELSMVLPRN